MNNEYYILNNGIKIPKVGLGTWLIDNDIVTDVVKEALRLGYRHIDTAQAYGNERGIGIAVDIAIKELGIPREDIFITSKVAAEIKDYDTAKKSIDESLNKLGVDYIDLMIIHSPQPWAVFRGPNKYYKENIEVYKALEDAYNEGKLKAIGVSNFLTTDLENILNNCKIVPTVNQVYAHINSTPFELKKYCEDRNILIEAYSPIAHGRAKFSNSINDMANKYHVSYAQLCIKYCLDLGMIVLPKTTNIEHLKNNLELDFEISKEDLNTLINMKDDIDYEQAKKHHLV